MELTKTSPWGQTLTGTGRERAIQIVRDIADALRQPGAEIAHPTILEPKHKHHLATLSNGYPGIAVFCAEFAQYSGDESFLEFAHASIERALAVLTEVEMRPGLFSGFCGVAWALARLHRLDPTRFAAEGIESVDEMLIKILSRPSATGNYDLMSGLVGFGVYALERDSLASDAILNLIVGHLEGSASAGVDGIAWLTDERDLSPALRETCPGGAYVVGAAHGIPGVIALLARIHRRAVAVQECERLCRGAVNWMSAHRLAPEERSIYPSFVSLNGDRSVARVAWCYGDPGVAAALWIAGVEFNERLWQDQAIEAGRKALNVPYEETGVVDASFCHGSAGLAHLFNRLYQSTKVAEFQLASIEWFARVEEFRTEGAGIAGYLYRGVTMAGGDRWTPEPGLLEGVAGIGLALLAGIGDSVPGWDSLFLLS